MNVYCFALKKSLNLVVGNDLMVRLREPEMTSRLCFYPLFLYFSDVVYFPWKSSV